MALFKPMKGNRTNLPSTMTEGWAYFCTDTGEFFIDYADDNGVLHRKQINADEANKIAGLTGGTNQIVSFDENGNLIAQDHENGIILKNLSASMPEVLNWKAITYGNGKFVAVGCSSSDASTNIAAYSEDGISWTATTMPTSGMWKSVTYGGGKFVALAHHSNKVAHSTDGITWTSATMPSSSTWISVTYGNGKFVAVTDSSSNKAAYSTDGATWTAKTLPRSANWKSVTYGDGKFVAVATSTNYAAYSTDGMTWNTSTMPVSGAWYSVTYGDGKFVSVSNNSTDAAYSTDGQTWHSANMPSSKFWYSVAYGNGMFVTPVNYGSSSSKYAVAYSTDGINWNETTMPKNMSWNSTVFGNGKFVTIANNGSAVAYSADGMKWQSDVTAIMQDDADVASQVMTALNAVTEAYVDEKIAAIPAPDVSGQIDAHNTASDAHSDIRDLIDDLTAEDVGAAKSDHNHDGRYYTENEINDKLSGKSDVDHTHVIADVSGLQNALDDKAAASHGTHVTYSTTAPVMDGTASVGSASTVARSDHKHPTDTSRAAQSDLTAHTGNKSNPHGVTKSQVGLGNVENKSSATIRGELTKANVTTALGYTPPTSDTVAQEISTAINDISFVDIDLEGSTSAFPNPVNADTLGGYTVEDIIKEVTPVRGVDYWTADDKAEIVADVQADAVQQTPLFAESLEWLAENGDTSKVYILPNNLIYAYMYTEGEAASYTNWLPIADTTTKMASDEPATLMTGYFSGNRLNSSGLLKKATGYSATGFIPYTYKDANDSIRIKGASYSGGSYTHELCFYGTSHNFLGYAGFSSTAGSTWENLLNDNINNTIGWTVTKESDGEYMLTWEPAKTNAIKNGTVKTADIAYIRICVTDFANAIITINEEIVGGGGTAAGYKWASTGHSFIPTDYEDRIIALEKKASGASSVQSYIAERNTYIAPVPSGYCESKNTYADTGVTVLDVYSLETMQSMFSALASANPDYITETLLGKDASGIYDIYKYELDLNTAVSEGYSSVMNTDKPVFIITAGLHGIEHDAVHEVYHFMKDLCENWVESDQLEYLRTNVKFVIVPISNPWGYVNLTYNNSNDVNLNKNFEHGFSQVTGGAGSKQNTGANAYSEAETVLLKGVFDEYSNAVFHLECHGKAGHDTAFNHVIWFSLMKSLKSELVEICSNTVIHQIGRRLYKMGFDTGKSEGGYITYYTLNGRPKDYTATEYGMLSCTMEGTGRMSVAGHTTYTKYEQQINAEALENFVLRVLDALNSRVEI